MKTLLATLAAVLVATTLAGSAKAFERHGDGVVITVQDRWERRGDWRDDDRRGPPPRRWDDRGPPPYEGRRFERGDDALSERQVIRRLVRQGFVRIEDIERRRDRYIVRAVRPNGALIRLAVDAYDGDIIARERIGWATGGRRGFERGGERPASGVEFDLGGGTLGIYSR